MNGLHEPGPWDLVAEAYAEVFEPIMGMWADDAIALLGVGPGTRLLDVAAGPGTVAFRAARKGAQVLAVDFSERMLQTLRNRIESERIEGVEAAQMDGQSLTVEDGSFDAAVSAFGLIFYPDRHKGFTEMRRALRPGGKAAVIGWGPLETSPLMVAQMQAMQKALPDMPKPEGTPPPFSLQDTDLFAQEMRAAGFSEVEVHAVDKTVPFEGTTEQFFDEQVPANVLLVSLEKNLPPPAWTKLRASIIEALDELRGDGPLELTSQANIGVGVA